MGSSPVPPGMPRRRQPDADVRRGVPAIQDPRLPMTSPRGRLMAGEFSSSASSSGGRRPGQCDARVARSLSWPARPRRDHATHPTTTIANASTVCVAALDPVAGRTLRRPRRLRHGAAGRRRANPPARQCRRGRRQHDAQPGRGGRERRWLRRRRRRRRLVVVVDVLVVAGVVVAVVAGGSVAASSASGAPGRTFPARRRWWSSSWSARRRRSRRRRCRNPRHRRPCPATARPTGRSRHRLRDECTSVCTSVSPGATSRSRWLISEPS